jgi:molybdenum cofactor cytidylyltransferase
MHTRPLIAATFGLPTVLVLASGRGERFTASGGQGPKLQADLLGMTVMARTLAAVQASGLPWHVEEGAHPGMGDSIAAAVRATRQAAGWLVLPGDLPLIQPQTLRALAEAQVAEEVVVPDFEGQRGHPVRFAPVCGDALAALEGPHGAASVIARFRSLRWPVADRGCVTDIDTLADLEHARVCVPHW